MVVATSAWEGRREARSHATLAYSAPKLQRPVDFNEEPMKVAIPSVPGNMESAKVLPSTAPWIEDLHGRPCVAAVGHRKFQNDGLKLLCDDGSGDYSPAIAPSVCRQQKLKQQQQKKQQKQEHLIQLQVQQQEQQQMASPSLQLLQTTLGEQAYPAWGAHLKSVTTTVAKMVSTNGASGIEAQASVFPEAREPSESLKTWPDGSVEAPTTLMLKQLPQVFAREALASLLNCLGFEGMYDFIYMPMNLLTKTSFTYAFVNMVSAEVAEQCRQQLDNYSNWQVPNSKACVALWAVQQGLEVNIERYRNSPVMHPSVPGDFKPALYKEGREIPFPPPTRELKAPKTRRVRK